MKLEIDENLPMEATLVCGRNSAGPPAEPRHERGRPSPGEDLEGSDAWLDRRPAGGLLAILTLATAVVLLTTYGPMRGLKKGRRARARADLSNLSGAIEMFRIDTERGPADLGDLLKASARAGVRWDGPYLKEQVVPVDPWGRRYVYRLDSVGYVLFSLGADGTEGGVEEDEDLRLTGALQLPGDW